MLRSTILTLATLTSLASLAVACGSPPPAKMTPATHDDGVPANAASEQRLGMNKPADKPAAQTDDPTQPLTTPLVSDPGATGGGGAGATTSTTAATPAGKNGKPGKGGKDPKDPKGTKGAAAAGDGTGNVTKAECRQLFDKYIELTVATDSRFADIPPEMIAQLKQSAMSQATSEKGDPCASQPVTRAQYNCAIAAPTTTAWQRCMPKGM